MAHFDEDRYSLMKRVERLETEHAWAEDPPSRTRRFVTNIRCWIGDSDDELVARSNLLLFRSRGDTLGPDLLSGQRTDLLRRTAKDCGWHGATWFSTHRSCEPRTWAIFL